MKVGGIDAYCEKVGWMWKNTYLYWKVLCKVLYCSKKLEARCKYGLGEVLAYLEHDNNKIECMGWKILLNFEPMM
jgi:hypothetical protein